MQKSENLIEQFAEAQEYKRHSDDVHKHCHKHKHKHRHKKHRHERTISLSKSSRLSHILSLATITLSLTLVEYFIVIGNLNFYTNGLITVIFGALMLTVYMTVSNLTANDIGLFPNKWAILSGIKNSLKFNILPIAAVLAGEYYYLENYHGGAKIDIYFSPFPFFGSLPVYIFGLLIYIIPTAIYVIFQETLFRGVMLKLGRREFGYWSTATFVSVFYALMHTVIALSSVIFEQSKANIIIYSLFYLFVSFALSMKWFYCTRATNFIWLSAFDHFVFSLLSLVHITDADGTTDEMLIIRLFVVQLLSCIICAFYCKNKHRRNRQLRAEKYKLHD